jgi:hypothetical protein
MWNWVTCYLSGRHEFGISCEPGAIFLRCMHCGRRSSGWNLGQTPQTSNLDHPATAAGIKSINAAAAARRILPFSRPATG